MQFIPDYIYNNPAFALQDFNLNGGLKKVDGYGDKDYGIMSPITNTWAFNVHEPSEHEAWKMFLHKTYGHDVARKAGYYVMERTYENGGLK